MDTTSSEAKRYDLAVVGGGAAGLSAALALSRAGRAVLVVDAGTPRNAPAGHVHNYLGREGTPPLELLAIGREEVASYGGEVISDRATGAERLPDGFRLTLGSGGAVEARRLLLATGLVDVLPEVDGLAERWGADVLHCPYCHGYEVRDQPLAVLGTSSQAVEQALLWRQWSAQITLVRHEPFELTAEQAEQVAARGIEVVDGPVVRVLVDDGAISGLELADGRVASCVAVVTAPRFEARRDLLDDLGLAVANFAMGDRVMGSHVPADPMGATDSPGVYVAGNVTNLGDTVIAAAAAALRTAHVINLDLVAEDTRLAVEALAATR